MSAAEFGAAFPGEGPFVEFKRGVSGKELQNTAVAFSNADGGVVLIGVTDDGHVSGRPLDAGTQDDIHRAMQEAHEIGRYSLTQLEAAGRPVGVLVISPRREGFSQTSQGVVRMRRGTRDDPLFGSELVRFLNERSAAARYESTPLGLGRDAIDPQLRSELEAAMSWEAASADRLRDAGLLDGERLTVAGALYLVRDARLSLGKAHVEILRFADDETIDYDRRVQVDGPLHHVLERAVAAVVDELGAELVVLGVRRLELPRLPESVVREAVANALAHRSYEASGVAVKVELRPSSVVVRSPGGLPEPVTVENIREASSARNVVVIRTLRRFGLAEDAGRGVDLMQDGMAASLLGPPRFEDSGHELVVSLPLSSPASARERAWIRELELAPAIQGGDRIALVHASRGEILTNARVRELLGLDADGARDLLQRLRDEGLLQQRGQRGGASYVLSDGVRPPGLRFSRDPLEHVVIRLAGSRQISNSDVRAATGLDRAEARALLDRLVRAGRLRRTGERRGTRYSLAD